MDIAEARMKFSELRGRGGRIDPLELDEVWAPLPVVRVEDILGRWKGDCFDTGHASLGMLADMRWYGKEFLSPLDAKPLICHDADGGLYSNVELANGEASLWMVEFRGEVTATMVYDSLAVLDHFKRVDDRTLFGIMNGKPEATHGGLFYFILEQPDLTDE
jgi:hypothetical protein